MYTDKNEKIRRCVFTNMPFKEICQAILSLEEKFRLQYVENPIERTEISYLNFRKGMNIQRKIHLNLSYVLTMEEQQTMITGIMVNQRALIMQSSSSSSLEIDCHHHKTSWILMIEYRIER